ncbi:MAG: 2'-5' RNA ligase family protein [Lachnospiraceae bacterium]|nr:2'-5' RNA ligase family protein [Lachnospiraceae bacterium]
MNLISEYEQRTMWKKEPISGHFQTAPDLERKVTPGGHYLPFMGSTVVFKADEYGCEIVNRIQDSLFALLSDTCILADPLPRSTTHMTLHDLLSPEQFSGSPEEYDQKVEDSLSRAVETAEKICHEFPGAEIHFTADRIVNMVSKSLVLLLRPGSEEDFRLLQECHRRFDYIVKLPYQITPHITLAYFRPGFLDGDRLGSAVDAVQIRQESAAAFAFPLVDLSVQRFLDMQTYLDCS